MSDQDRWSNQLFVNDNQPLTQSRADILAVNLQALYNNFEDRCTETWDLDSIRVYDLSEADAPAYDADISPVTGTSSGDAFQQVAVVLTWLTGLPGRKFRGRTYLAGFANDQFTRTDDGPLLFNDPTVRGSVLNGASAYFDAMVADGAIPVVYSRVGAGAQTAINGARVGSVPDTQRRRRDQVEEDYAFIPLP